MSYSARTGLQLAAPVFAVVLLSSCAPQANTRLSPQRSFTQFSEREIADVSPVTAYDAVSRLRPMAVYAGGRSLFEPTVYLDGLKLGGLDQLQLVSATDLVGIQFLTAMEASARFGPTARNGGAILLSSRNSRRVWP